AGGVLWNTSGAGTYTPSNTSLIASYNPTAADVAAGAVNLSITTTSNGLCKAVSDFVTITLIPAPTAAVDAGFDQTICADVTAANLNGKIQNAGGGVWSSNGTGTFVPNASTLNATYQLSAADRALASVTLTLTTTGNGPCAAVSDQLVITISSRPSVAAGADQSLCADVNSIAINGTVTVATGGIWTSGGTGTFTPNAATLTASYIPSAQDITAGKVGLTLTSTGNGTCNAKSDDLLITFSAKPTANAGIDQTVCADITSLKITGSVTAATGGTWVSTGSGTFTPNANALIITYTPSAADKNAGRVNLTLSTTGMSNGCNAVQDQMSITLTPTPTVNAGPDKTVCADIGSSALSGSVTVASGGIWTTTGSGVFSLSSSSLAASYAPSQADKALGSVKLILTSSGNGTCNAVKDTMIMTILPKPVVTVGSVSNCVFTSGAALSGVVTNASGGQWSTSGSGLFSPNEFALNASYFPSAADIASGKATLTLTSTGNGTCNPVSASTNVIISPLPLANAGSDQFVCRNGSTVLSAQTSSNVTYLWKTLSGTSIVASQFANVTITKDTNFVLTVTDKKGCFSSDTIAVQAIDQPSFGLPAQHCLTDSTVLHALVSGSYPNGIYTWYKSNILIPNQNDSTLKVRSSGTYSVIYTVGSCATSPKSTVVTDPLLLITNRKQVVCTGSTVSLATTTVPSAPAGTTFDWKLSNTSIANSNPSSISALVDTNVYKVTVTDNLGCISYDSIKVIGIPKPDPMLKDSTTCAGGNIPLNGKPANISNVDSLFPAYQWTKNGTSLSTDSSIIVNASGRYIVSITIGSCSNQDTSDINFNPVPSRINPNMMGFCSETDSVILNAGNPGARYLWSVPTADTTRFITVSSAGIYHVKITNSFLCSIDDSVTVKDVCPPRLFMPEGFWPVGDPSLADTTTGRGKDAFFGIFGAHISNENFDLSVFNRWGELIFHTTDKNETWDGKYKGDLIPTGVYPWTVKYQGDSEEFKGPYKLEGRVVLFR
ncbi:MAG: gliding motility-associated C-terminal domain-containing protein, partial [Cytophagaceae bacterium]